MATEKVPGVGNASAGSGVDLRRLQAYVTQSPELRHSAPVESITRIGKGQSNLTFRVQLADRSVILRRPPTGPLPPKAHDVLREYRVISALAGSPVPVPRPLLPCDDPAIIGAPFFLMEDVPGDAIRFRLSPALQIDGGPQRITGQVVDVLISLHALHPADVGLAELSRPSGYLERQLTLWKAQLDYARVRTVPDLDWVSHWLERTLPREVARPSIVHGDYKLDNTLFAHRGPELLAVVDWEMAALGDPLADLGWLLAFWCEHGTPPPELSILPRVTELPEFPRRKEIIDLYRSGSGRALTNMRFYVVFALWKMAILLEAHWARHVRGTATEFDFAYLEGAGPIFATYIRRVASGELEF